jgi:hypothetical protein
MLPAMRLIGLVAILGSGLAIPNSVAAYCRTTTEETVASGCPEVCQTEGIPLYWPTRSLHYVRNERPFPDLAEAQVRSIVKRSFDAWTAVACEGEPLQLTVAQSSGTTTLEAGPVEDEPNDNVIAYIDAENWQDEPRAFAITKIWYNHRNGHILGADMLINGHMDPFGVCPTPRGCVDDSVTDLSNVVTHEAGHFLGLAHSDDEASTMWCDAAPGDIDKRSLEADDVAGICSIYGPDADPGPEPEMSSKKSGVLCRAAGGARQSSASAAGLLALLIAALGVRRRQTR